LLNQPTLVAKELFLHIIMVCLSWSCITAMHYAAIAFILGVCLFAIHTTSRLSLLCMF